jgi:hypothetical protein
MHREEKLNASVGLQTLQPEFVPVVFAADPREAAQVRSLFEQYDIPVLLDDGLEGEYLAAGRGIPVLVPEELHERAALLLGEADAPVIEFAGRDDDEEEEDFVEDDDEEVDDDFDDLDDLDDDFEEEEDDDVEADFDADDDE